MSYKRPKIDTVLEVASRYINNIRVIGNVKKGSSTYVFKVISTDRVYYIRFLPETHSFSTEVLAHQMLSKKGVKVPRVLHYEVLNKETNLSMMVLDEIKGCCIEDENPKENLENILFEAGKELALLHSIPVNGFGWIDKSILTELTGEFEQFNGWYCEYIKSDLDKLKHYDFTDLQVKSIHKYMTESKILLNTSNGVLVHGDFDISHIFHDKGAYAGLIDFGEIRGSHFYYDLATFIGFYQNEESYQYLLLGYRSQVDLSKNDLYGIELMALSIIVRFLGKKYDHSSKNHWYHLTIKQLERLDNCS